MLIASCHRPLKKIVVGDTDKTKKKANIKVCLNTLRPQADWDNYKTGIGKKSHNAKRICHHKKAMVDDWWRGISSVTLVLSTHTAGYSSWFCS